MTDNTGKELSHKKFEAVKGSARAEIVFFKRHDDTWSVYEFDGINFIRNWSVTVGRRFDSKAEACEFLSQKGWMVTKEIGTWKNPL